MEADICVKPSQKMIGNKDSSCSSLDIQLQSFCISIRYGISESFSSSGQQVLTVVVDGVNKLSGASTHACLNLVDLAGSERVAKSKAAGTNKLTLLLHFPVP
jgi:hypothetical protein